MKKTTYWKDVWRTFVASKGRMLSIALLMALGSFALIGLKVTSPNMKKTGEHFFKTHQTADLSLISTYSINQTDQDLLNTIKKKNVDISKMLSSRGRIRHFVFSLNLIKSLLTTLLRGNFLLRTGKSLFPQLIKKNIASEIRLTFLSQ